jgi:hypothetical protein
MASNMWTKGTWVPTSKAVGCPVRTPKTYTNTDGTSLKGYEYGRCVDAAGSVLYVNWNTRPQSAVQCGECEVDLTKGSN